MKTDEAKGGRPLRARLRRAGEKMLRLDRPAGPGTPEADKAKAVETGGNLIDLLLRAIRADPADRRRDVRHPAVEQEVWVGWWRGDDFAAIRGRMLNISRGGAEIIVGCRPPRKTSVWLYKDIGSTLATVRGEVIAYDPAPDGAHAVRFRFAAPCPTVFCEAVVCRHSPDPEGDGREPATRQT